MSDSNTQWSIRLLVDAKKEYTKQLLDILTPRFYEGIKSLYSDSKVICKKIGNNEYLINFQKLLKHIPKWNTQILDNEYNRIILASNCDDFLENLIHAIFIANTKVLTAINSDKTINNSITLTIPNGRDFIHKCYVQIAREFWKNPYLLDDTISSVDIQRNLRDSYSLIEQAVNESIRKQLPVKAILQEYLGKKTNINESYNETDDIESVLTNSDKDNLKGLINHTIKSNNINEDIISITDNNTYKNLESTNININSQINTPNNSPVGSLSIDTPKNEEIDTHPNEEIDIHPNEEIDTHPNEEIDIPKNQEIDTPKNEEIDTPKNEEIDTPKNEEIDTPKNEEIDIPKNEEIDTLKETNNINPIESYKHNPVETLNTNESKQKLDNNIKTINIVENVGNNEKSNINLPKLLKKTKEITLVNSPFIKKIERNNSNIDSNISYAFYE